MALVYRIKFWYYSKVNKRALKRIGCNIPTSLVINGIIKVYGKGTISIGDNVRINSGEKYNPIGGMDHTLFSVRNGGKICIGKNVGISNSAIVARSEIIIEDDVRIGGNCKIYDNDFHSTDFNNRINKNDPDIKTSPVKICKGAFIGAHTIVLKGVTIGPYSVVGAGSVITKSIPEGEVWAGNPAHFIRKVKDENCMDN